MDRVLLLFRMGLFLCVMIASATSQSDSSRDVVSVIMPEALVEDVGDLGKMLAKPGLFGKFYYGRTLDAPFRLLKQNDTDTGFFACERFQIDIEKLERPFIALVRRGGCTFVTKARNIQDAGGAAMVVVNDDLNEPTYMGIAPSDYAVSNAIDIPAMMIRKLPGEKIIDQLVKNVAVRGQMQVLKPSPAKEEVLNVDLYLRLDDNPATFMQVFALALANLKDTAKFSVHFILDSGLSKKACTNNGRYCAQNRDAVVETLRQLCIFKHKGWKEWADYYNIWSGNCGSMKDYSENCFRQIFKDSDIIETCMTESGGLDRDNVNTLLDAEAHDPRGIRYGPLLLINDAIFESQLTCNSVHDCAPLSFLCMMFADSDQPSTCFTSSACESFGEIPDVCGTCRAFGDQAAVTDPSKCPANVSRHHHIPFVAILIIFVALSLIMFVIIVFINRRLQRMMRSEIDSIMSEYTPLHDAYPDSPNFSLKDHYRIPAA